MKKDSKSKWKITNYQQIKLSTPVPSFNPSISQTNVMTTKNIILAYADITSTAVDAMVNSANKSMLMGSGLCRIIHKKGGDVLTQACKELHQANKAYPTGTALATPAGNLPAKYVIHAVAPKWYEHEDKDAPLIDVYQNILTLADSLKVKVLSLPALATGIHKYPFEVSADVALRFLVECLPECLHVEQVILMCGSKDCAVAYKEAAQSLKQGSELIVDLIPELDWAWNIIPPKTVPVSYSDIVGLFLWRKYAHQWLVILIFALARQAPPHH